MCNIWNSVKIHKLFILFLGLFIILVSAFLLISHPIISLISMTIGLLLFFIGIVLFLYQKFAGENSWKHLYYYVVILALLLWGVIATKKIQSADIQNIQNTYITIDIAIISVTFAALAINSDKLVPLLKKVKKTTGLNDPPTFNIEHFQNFIIVTAFMILVSVFVSVFSLLSPDTAPLLNIIYIHSFLFGMTTCLTIVLIFILMGQLFSIIDKILYPEKYK